MPKITSGGGPSNRFEPQPPQERPGEGVFFLTPVAGADPEAVAELAAAFEQSENVQTVIILPESEPEQEGDEPSPGNSSSTSLTPSGRTTKRRASKAQLPAPTTEPPSSQPPTEADGGAPTATTSGPETGGESSANPAADQQ